MIQRYQVILHPPPSNYTVITTLTTHFICLHVTLSDLSTSLPPDHQDGEDETTTSDNVKDVNHMVFLVSFVFIYTMCFGLILCMMIGLGSLSQLTPSLLVGYVSVFAALQIGNFHSTTIYYSSYIIPSYISTYLLLSFIC